MRVYLNKNKVNEEQDFIFYNHIFSRGKSKFTVEKFLNSKIYPEYYLF